MIFSTQYSFTIASIVFQSTSIKDQLNIFMYGSTHPDLTPEQKEAQTLDWQEIWTLGWFVIVVLSLLALVRNIATFRVTFVFANFLLLSSIIIVCCYSINKMMTDGVGPNIVPINFNGLWSMIGFSIYMFEGIGILMPCM